MFHLRNHVSRHVRDLPPHSCCVHLGHGPVVEELDLN